MVLEIIMFCFIFGIPIMAIAWMINSIVKLFQSIIDGSKDLKYYLISLISSVILLIGILCFYAYVYIGLTNSIANM